MLKNLSKILLGLSLFAPLIVDGQLFFPFITGKTLLFRLLIELALLCFLLHIILSKDRKAQFQAVFQKLKNPIVISLTLFTLLFVISSFTALNSTQAFWSNFERGDGGFQIIHYYIFFLLILFLFQKKKDFEKLLFTSLLVAVYISVYGLLQWLKLDPRFGIIGDPNRISGTLGNASYLAALMLFSIGYLLYFLIRTKNIALKIFGYALIPFFVVILFKTGTRGALLGLAASGITFFTANIFRKDCAKWLKNTSIIMISIALLFSALFFSTYKNPNWQKIPLLGRQLNLETTVEQFQPRIWSWNAAIQGFIDKPFLGWGAENYPYVYDKYYHPGNYGRESFFDRVHNLYLEHLVSGGILLFLAFFALLFSLFKRIFKKKKNLWFSILLSIPVAYMVQAFFLFDVLVIYLSFYILLALVLNNDIEKEESGLALRFNNKQIIAIFVASLLLLINTLFLQQGATLVIPIVIVLALIIFYEKTQQESYFASLLDALISLSLIFITILLIYSTIYLPYKKNKALVATFTTNKISEKFDYFKNALATPSPIGQEEVVGSLDNFLLSISDQLVQGVVLPVETVMELTDFTNAVHDQYADMLPGLRHTYTNGGANIRIGYFYGQPQLVRRGKQLYYDALQKSPTRIEFMVLLIEAAKAEGDKQGYEALRQAAISLRPDLAENWPPIENL